jgi:anti-anti-sigma factor
VRAESPFRVTLRSENGNHVEFEVAGEIDASTHEQLRSQMIAAIGRGAKDLVVDVTEVTFMDSSGLRGFIESIRLGASVTLRHVQPAVRQIFDIVEIPGLKLEN